jgi:hypothetical protein
MKGIIAYLLLFIGLNNNIFPQILDHDDYIDYYDFIGVYLPIEHMTSLENTKNYILSMNLYEYNDYYTILVVTRNAILYDSYSYESPQNIPVWEIMNYKFEYNDGYLIIDNNGNKYKKISDDIENWTYNVHRNYVLNIILKELLDQGEAILNENGFIIPSLNNKQFGAMTYYYGFLENANLYLVDESGNRYVLEIKNNEYIIYRLHNRRWEKDTIIWSKKL